MTVWSPWRAILTIVRSARRITRPTGRSKVPGPSPFFTLWRRAASTPGVCRPSVLPTPSPSLITAPRKGGHATVVWRSSFTWRTSRRQRNLPRPVVGHHEEAPPAPLGVPEGELYRRGGLPEVLGELSLELAEGQEPLGAGQGEPVGLVESGAASGGGQAVAMAPPRMPVEPVPAQVCRVSLPGRRQRGMPGVEEHAERQAPLHRQQHVGPRGAAPHQRRLGVPGLLR